MMTDGWYSIQVQLDKQLQSLAKKGKIYVGQKLYIQGAELVGSDQAVSPLEVAIKQFLLSFYKMPSILKSCINTMF